MKKILKSEIFLWVVVIVVFIAGVSQFLPQIGDLLDGAWNLTKSIVGWAFWIPTGLVKWLIGFLILFSIIGLIFSFLKKNIGDGSVLITPSLDSRKPSISLSWLKNIRLGGMVGGKFPRAVIRFVTTLVVVGAVAFVGWPEWTKAFVSELRAPEQDQFRGIVLICLIVFFWICFIWKKTGGVDAEGVLLMSPLILLALAVLVVAYRGCEPIRVQGVVSGGGTSGSSDPAPAQQTGWSVFVTATSDKWEVVDTKWDKCTTEIMSGKRPYLVSPSESGDVDENRIYIVLEKGRVEDYHTGKRITNKVNGRYLCFRTLDPSNTVQLKVYSR